MPLGTYKEAFSARSTEQKILDVSQDGGIVSALLCYALDEGIIEGAVVAGTPDDDWRPIPTVVTSSDEVTTVGIGLQSSSGVPATTAPSMIPSSIA